MSSSFFPARRLAFGLALAATVAACNTNTANDGVRNGPQAVHPSPSALAQGTTVAPAPMATATCGTPGAPACYAPQPDDGSQPFDD